MIESLHMHLKGAFNNYMDKERGEGVHQMSTIVHVREGGGHCSVQVDKILKKGKGILAAQV